MTKEVALASDPIMHIWKDRTAQNKAVKRENQIKP